MSGGRTSLVMHKSIIIFLSLVILATMPNLQGILENKEQSELLAQERSAPSKSRCLSHGPIAINVTASPAEQLRVIDQLSENKFCGRLARDWTGYNVQSPLAREIAENQAKCSWPVGTFELDNRNGMGSHLHQWSQAVCNAHEMGQRLHTYNPEWLWLDQSRCDMNMGVKSPFLCYFPSMEYRCGLNETRVKETPFVRDPRWTERCKRAAEEPGFVEAYRAASMEYVFRHISPIVVQEAERQIGMTFADLGGAAPDDLITVHIRWGDKSTEMSLAVIDEYITAVSDLLIQGKSNNSTANIYLASEDPEAYRAFSRAAPPGWMIYTDRMVTELSEFRPADGNQASTMAKNTKGRAGLVALGSLLVALEADNFVLTTGSNWSRLINELRKNVVDRKCGNCTKMIDLRRGEW